MPKSLFDDLRAQRFNPKPAARLKPNFFARVARGCWNAAPLIISFWLIFALASGYSALRSFQTPSTAKLDIPSPLHSAQDLAQKFPGLENLQTILLANGNANVLDDQRADLVATLRQQKDVYELVFAPGFGDYYEAHGLLYHPLNEVNARVAYATSLKPLFSAIAAAPNANSMATLVNEVSASISQNREPQGLEDLFAQSAASLQALMAGEDQPVDWSKIAAIQNESTATTATILAIPKPGAAVEARAMTLKLLDVIKSSSTTLAKLEQAETPNTAQNAPSLNGPRAIAAGIIGVVFAGLVLALSLGRVRLAMVGAAPVLCAGLFAATAILNASGPLWSTFWPLLLVVVLGTTHMSVRYAANVIETANGQGARETSVMLASQNYGRALLWILSALCLVVLGLIFLQDHQVQVAVGLTLAGILLGYLSVITLMPALFRAMPDAAKWRAGDWLIPAHQALFETGQWQFLARGLVALGAATSLYVLFTIAPFQKVVSVEGPVNILVNSEAKAREVIQNLKSVDAAQSVRWLAMFLPEDVKAKRESLSQLKDQFPRIDPVASEPPQDLRDQLDTLGESLKEISATPETKPALKKAADEFRRSLALLGATSGDEQVRQLENRLFGGFNRLADRADVLASVSAPTMETLPEELRKLFMSADGEFRLEVLPAAGVSNRKLALALDAYGFDPIHPALAQDQKRSDQLRQVYVVFGFGVVALALLVMFKFGASADLTFSGAAIGGAIFILVGAERLWQTDWNLQWLLIGVAVLANLGATLIKTPMAKPSTALSAIEVFLLPTLCLCLALPHLLLQVDLLAEEMMPISLALCLSAVVVGLLQQHGDSSNLLNHDDYGIDG
jgi:uncharacterized protein